MGDEAPVGEGDPERRKLRMEPNLLDFWYVVHPIG
jgi:hypothetical protein